MPEHHVIVIGTSAGGVDALRRLVRVLPDDLPAPVFVVMHMAPNSFSALPEILTRLGGLPAAHATHGEAIRPRRIYVAPPDFHMILEHDRVRLSSGATENNFRPSIDPLFRSAAEAFGARAIGVLLTGSLDDGTAGLIAIKARGGVAVVQHPDDAMFRGMPESAIEHVDDVDFVLPLDEIPAALEKLVRRPADTPLLHSATSIGALNERNGASGDVSTASTGSDSKAPSGFICPDCGGALFPTEEKEALNLRCRTGHAYSPATLAARQDISIEASLWTAVRMLEERRDLAKKLANRARKRGSERMTEHFEQRAADSQTEGDLIRGLICRMLPTLLDGPGSPVVDGEGSM